MDDKVSHRAIQWDSNAESGNVNAVREFIADDNSMRVYTVTPQHGDIAAARYNTLFIKDHNGRHNVVLHGYYIVKDDKNNLYIFKPCEYLSIFGMDGG